MATEAHVLVADDSTVTRMVERRILSSLGRTRIIEAKNGQEALDCVLRGDVPIELVLLDWNMPILDGLQFVERTRKLSSFASVPILMVSATSTPAKVMEALRAGATGYVIKPFHPNEFRVKVGEALALARMRATAETETRSARPTLRGNLADIGVPALVQMAAAARLTGMLRLTIDDGGPAVISVVDGEPKACWMGFSLGEEAFLALAARREGTFEFRHELSDEPPNLFRSGSVLLMEALRLQDEALRTQAA